jgi:uncharacterized protein
MNTKIINEIAKTLNVRVEQVEKTLELLKEGNTIPFISRYRKEATGSLDEEQIRKINEVYLYQVKLLERKESVINLIKEKDLLTKELEVEIMRAIKLVDVEDLYRPFKEKKKTKATTAINNGLTPLADLILTFPNELDCTPYLNGVVSTREGAIEGAKYIIAETISDNAMYRRRIRTNTFIFGTLKSKKKKNIDNLTYEMYYDYEELIKRIKPHRVMALNRAEKEKVVSVSVNMDTDRIIDYLKNKVILQSSKMDDILIDAIKDAYKRLIKPSIEREIRKELTEKAEINAVDNFSKNLERLLLTRPMKEKIVLGFDPAFRTGCKLAVIDKTGKKLEVSVIYPTQPHNKIKESKKHILDLINKYDIDIIAIGNGTASRESEAFIVDVVKESTKKVEYIIVSEAGASVYSASKLAIEEFPDLTVEKRSAISIGRRLQDPLSELVKIDPD